MFTVEIVNSLPVFVLVALQLFTCMPSHYREILHDSAMDVIVIQ